MSGVGNQGPNSKCFCMGMNKYNGKHCLHEQEAGDKCERCGSTNMYPIRLYGLRSAMDAAFNAAQLSNDEHMVTAMSRVHEAFENILYELKRISDEFENQRQS